MGSNAAVITELMNAWNERDVEGILELFTDDAVYLNIPIDPAAVGIEEIRKVVEGYIIVTEEIEFIVHHMTENADGSVVMNERTDRSKIDGRWREVRVVGVFEFRDGRISAWRDYFDASELRFEDAAG